MENLVYNKDELEIFIVNNDSSKFIDGRILTKDIYYNKFRTTNIKDNYDFGMVMYYKGVIIFNLSFTIHKNNLPFLKFFELTSEKITINSSCFEVSGLVIKKNDFKYSNYLLFLGLLIIKTEIIDYYKLKTMITIQNQGLIKRLNKSGYGEFFKTIDDYKIKPNFIPNDKYWTKTTKPKIYISDFSFENEFFDKIKTQLMKIGIL